MKIYELKCPSCGNYLEVEDSLDTFFCKYCGHRIVLADQSEHLVKAKVDIERLKHEERMYQMQLEEAQRKREDSNRDTKIFLIFNGLILLGCAIGMLIYQFWGGG